ncbi:MAG TPA: acetyl-CoA carboxylase biotin carboxylase subunit [Anaeromyxobacteraceae bacterium]|nr:acetyl-CoA carboxylase biotin carboxylase subunit [Anaeromyxobacteraceae bacterium]
MSKERSPFRKVLVANRGEIAVRVMRTCREMGLPTVAVYSDADRGSLHVRFADEAVRIGPPPSRESYLGIDRIVAACQATGADAVHPGYGFLSEKAEFARALQAAGITFIGPPASSMDAMGVKTTARKNMQAAGVPTVPGSASPIASESEARAFADGIGYPVMIKAAAGGGGKGMKKCERGEDFQSLWQSARREAVSAFGDDRLYIEKFLDKPRHVEIQVFADDHGHCIYLGERECSVQRRQQKVIEESPSCILDEGLRSAMGQVAVKAAEAVHYRGAGTVEFLVDARRNFYFLEMNTRLQVEHPVTEMCTGLDLVRMQIQVAQGEPLPLRQEEVVRRGHAIEARVYAEDPSRKFMPCPGRISYLRVPNGPGIRDDSGVYTGWVVPQFYDPMISKLLAWAPTREQAIERLKRALAEYTVHGITVNLTYLKEILDHPAFRSGEYDTGFCSRFEKELLSRPDPRYEQVALIAAAVVAFKRDHDEAEAFAARADGQPGWSQWQRIGRSRTLRGSMR